MKDSKGDQPTLTNNVTLKNESRPTLTNNVTLKNEIRTLDVREGINTIRRLTNAVSTDVLVVNETEAKSTTESGKKFYVPATHIRHFIDSCVFS